MTSPDELVDAFDEAARRSRDLSAPLDELGGSILQTAAPRSPRRTGLLAGSLAASSTAGSLIISSTARHFWPVHNGRKRRGVVRPRPWVADAIKASESNTISELETYVVEPIERL